MNRTRRIASRVAKIGLASGIFLLAGMGSPQTQDTIRHYVAVAHGAAQWTGIAPTPVSLIDTDIDVPVNGILPAYVGSMELPFGTFLRDMTAYPDHSTPSSLLAVSGNGSVYRIRPNLSGIDSQLTVVGASIWAATLVSNTPLVDHYAVLYQIPGGITSSLGFALINPSIDTVLDEFQNGTLGNRPTQGMAFNYYNGGTPNIPDDDFYRYFIGGTADENLTTDSIWMLELNDAQARVSVPDPFGNPEPSHGPPYPQVPVFLDFFSQGWSRRFNVPDGDDTPSMKFRTWRSPTNGRNYLICASTHLHPGASPTWSTHVVGCDIDILPLGLTPTSLQANITANYPTPPTFHDMEIAGNFLFIVNGSSPLFSGGVECRAFFLSGTGGTATTAGTISAAVPSNSHTFVLPTDVAGYGVISSFDAKNLFVGADFSNNLMWKLYAGTQTVNAVTNTGFWVNPPAGQPTFQTQNNVIQSRVIPMATLDEINMGVVNPNRIWPGRSSESFEDTTGDLIGGFDGNDNASPGKECELSAPAGAAISLGMAAVAALMAIGAAFLIRR